MKEEDTETEKTSQNIKISGSILELIDNVITEDELKFKSRQQLISFLVRYYVKDRKRIEIKSK